jgi:hypothetical protein
MTPTAKEVRDFLREHYGLTLKELCDILNTPTHPKGLRDEFAGQAMSAMISGSLANGVQINKPESLVIVNSAFAFADAMLEARNAE